MSRKAKRRKPKERFLERPEHPPSMRSEANKSKLLQILDDLERDSERRAG